MSKIVFITGGATSGKSSFACKLAEKYRTVSVIVTAEALDREMSEKINKHKLSRPKSWQVIESGHTKLEKMLDSNIEGEICIIDCITMYVSNLLMDLKTEEEIIESIKITIKKIKQAKKVKKFIIVSNEVGMGIVPSSKLGRRFREILGNVNKIISFIADVVYLQVSGITIKIKG